MHNQGIGSSGMDQENQLAHVNNNLQWTVMGDYIHTPVPVPDYGSGSGFGYTPPISQHGLPSESIGRMAPVREPMREPTPQQPLPQPPPHHHSTLPMLMVPSHPTWPSMLTNPNTFTTSPPVAIPPTSYTPVQHQLKTARRIPAQPPTQPRKTLTDDDRRRMCQYHEDHPAMKQTEIGALFGVERSTVSKVLSRKDKWLNPEDRSSSPIKKNKGKIPDIDKTLANWLRNEQSKGRHVSDLEIQEQARMYARPFREAETKINNPSWLEKFKQKQGMGGRLLRRASETNIPSAVAAHHHSMTASPVLTDSQPSSAISPSSPVNSSASPPSANRGDEGKERLSELFSEGNGNNIRSRHTANQWREVFPDHTANQSTTSWREVFTDHTAESSFSENTMSPTAQFTFSPDPNMGGFLSSGDQARSFPPGGPNFQRPRSQTFPTLDLEYMNQTHDNQSTEPMTPKYHHVSSTTPSSALESPVNETVGPPFGLDSTIASPAHQLHHSSSTSSLRQQQQSGNTPIMGSTSLSSVASSPISPTQEDARRAADTILAFIANSGRNSFLDETDYNAVIRLTEKLRLHQQQQRALQGMGGLDRIPEGDAEMGNTALQDEFIKHELRSS